jgi:hypothetical protein
MRYAILRLALRSRHLVIIGKRQLVTGKAEYCICSPLDRVGRTAASTKAAAPFVGEYDLLSVIGERSRVPVSVVRIVDRINTFRIGRIFDVQDDTVT